MGSKKLPLVSVVMAVHEIPQEILKQAVDSILNQTFNDFEFIIICDAPNNGGVYEVLCAYTLADSRVVVYYNDELCGFPRSINRAIAAARGRYVVRMDADDVSLPERIRLQVLFMERNPCIGISGMQAEVIDEQGRIVGRMRKPCKPENVTTYLRHASPVVHPTYIVRREIYEQLNGYREFSPGQDYEFLIRASRIGIVIGNQPCVGLKYRVNDDSLSHRSMRRTMKMGQMMRRLARNRRLDFPALVGPDLERESHYLKKVYHLRNTLVRYGRRGSPLLQWGSLMAAAAASFLHPDLLRDAYHGFQGARIVRREAVDPG